MHPSFFLFLILVFVTYRITRLITEDILLDAPRSYLESHLPTFFSDLITCPHCFSVWCSAAVISLTDLFLIHLPLPGFWWGAVAGAVSLLFSFV